jgi:hypothetical protein
MPDLEPAARLDHDREFAPSSPDPASAKKIGPRISAAQV